MITSQQMENLQWNIFSLFEQNAGKIAERAQLGRIVFKFVSLQWFIKDDKTYPMAVISFIRTFKGSDKNVQISVTAFFSEFGISNNERKVVFGKMSELVGKNDFEGLLKLSGLVDPFVILFHS